MGDTSGFFRWGGCRRHGRGNCSLIQIFRIVFDAMSLEEEAKFVDEGYGLMVLVLGFDVVPDFVAEAGADGEGCIALLPCEFRAMMAGGPDGGGLFEFAHEVLDAVVCVEADEEVDVVLDAADGADGAAKAADGSAEVLVESAAPAGVDEGLALIGAEDYVVVEGYVGGHVEGVSGTPFGVRVLGGGVPGVSFRWRCIQPPATALRTLRVRGWGKVMRDAGF